MTKEQKRLIDQYRQSGMKYSEIARTISAGSRSYPGDSDPAASALMPAGTNTG